MVTKAHPAPLALVLLLVLAGCDTGTEPGRELTFDPVARQTAIEDFFGPIEAAAEARASLASAWEDLEASHGVQFERAAPGGGILQELRWGRLGIQAFIPQEIRGQTFIYAPGEDRWVVDESRTGAPEDGIRIVYYATTASGSISFPLVERGFIELTDRETGGLDDLGTRIVNTAGQPVVVGDYTQGYSLTETQDGYTEASRAQGSFSDGELEIGFEVGLDAGYDAGEDILQEDFILALSRPGTTFDWSIASMIGPGDSYDDDFTVQLVHEGSTTILRLNLTGTEAGPEPGTGTLTHDGTVVADITLTENNQIQAAAPEGPPFSSFQRGQIEALAFAMFYYGVLISLSLPILT